MAATERPSPFTIPQPQWKFADGPGAESVPPQPWSVRDLIQNLTNFADFYEQASAAIDREETLLQRRAIASRDVYADVAIRQFRAALGIDRVRAYVLVNCDSELTIAASRRFLGDVIRVGGLGVDAAESLNLEAAMDLLDAANLNASDTRTPHIHNGNTITQYPDGRLRHCWRANGKDVSALSDGWLAEKFGGDAPWLPQPWKLDVFPVGLSNEHLRRFLEYAVAMVESTRKQKVDSTNSAAEFWDHFECLAERCDIAVPSELRSHPNFEVRLRDMLSIVRKKTSNAQSAEGTSKEPQKKAAGPETAGGPAARARKRSTVRGEGQAKLIAALTAHHKYAKGSCLNSEPIGNNALAKAAKVAGSTASAFFNNEFGGWNKYRVVCRDAGRLVESLKVMNGEFSPHELYGRRPPDEDDRDGRKDRDDD